MLPSNLETLLAYSEVGAQLAFLINILLDQETSTKTYVNHLRIVC